MRNKVTGIVAAVALAAAGTLGIVAFVQGAERRALAGERVVNALVVKQPIEAGTPAAEIQDRVATKSLPAKLLLEDAITDLGQIAGQVAAVRLLPGEQLSSQRFLDPEYFSGAAAGLEIPDDKLQVTVALDPERAVGGVLRPGSEVGVLASFEPFDTSNPAAAEFEGTTLGPNAKTANSTHMVLQNVLVTNVQFDTGANGTALGNDDEDDEAARAPSGRLLVTLALDAPQVETLVFAAEHGTVWLALQPAKASGEGTRIVTRANIHQ